MAKTGRPKKDEIKEHILSARVSNDEWIMLREYADKHDMTMTQAILTAIHRLCTGKTGKSKV